MIGLKTPLSALIIILLLIPAAVGGLSISDVAVPFQTEPPSGQGNWTVSDTTVIRNRTIELNGNLTVAPSGYLVLDNSTLVMNVSYNGQYSITVNGRMDIINGSLITSKDRQHRYNLLYHKNSSVTSKGRLMDSTIEYCGYNGGTYGPWIQVDNIPVVNMTFRYNYQGLRLFSSTKDVTGCRFIKNDDQGLFVYQYRGTIRDCLFQQNGGSNSTDGEIPLGDEGLLVWYSSPRVVNNTFLDNVGESKGTANIVVIQKSSNPVVIENNTISQGEMGIIAMETDLYVRNNTIEDMDTAGVALGTSGHFDGPEYATITNNTFTGNLVGVAIAKADDNGGPWKYAKIANNTFYNDDGGIAVYGPHHTYMHVNTLIAVNNSISDSGAGIIFLWGDAENANISHNYGTGTRVAMAFNHSYVSTHDNGILGGNMSYPLPSWVEDMIGPDVKGELWVDNSSVVHSINDTIHTMSIKDNSTLYLTGYTNITGVWNISDSRMYPSSSISVSGSVNITNSTIFMGTNQHHIFFNISGYVNISDSSFSFAPNTTDENSTYSLAFLHGAHGYLMNSSIAHAGNGTNAGVSVMSDSMQIEDDNFTANSLAFYSDSHVLVVNSTFSDTEQQDVYAYGDANVSLLNCSFSPEYNFTATGNATISLLWYLNVMVNSTSGAPISGANITICENASDKPVISGTSDDNGTMRWNIVTEFIQNASSVSYSTPHTVCAHKDGLSNGSTRVFVNRSMWVYVSLYMPSAPTNLSAFVSGSDILLTWNDTAGADHYEIFRSTEMGALGTIIANISQGTEQYTDTNVVGDGTDYYYTLKAVDPSGIESTATYQVMKHDQSLSAGLNTISLILYPSEELNSYNLLNGQSHEIPGCTQVSEWTNSGWKSSYFTWGEPDGTNFTLEVGYGYFVRVSSDTIMTTAGRVIDSPITLNLTAGLNFIAIPYSTVNYTSYNLLNGQSHEIPGCTQVSEWTNSGWKSSYFTWGEPDGTNFTLIPGQGYFVRVSSDVQWTPEIASPSSTLLADYKP